MRTLLPWISALVGCAADPPSDGPGTASDPSSPVSSPPPTGTTPPIGPTTTTPPPPLDALGEILADAFRIALHDVDVVLDVVPDQSIDGHATLTFAMRQGQVRPLFHFDPQGVEGLDALSGLALDGEVLDPTDPADLQVITFPGSPERAFELQRDVSAGEHTIVVDWSVPAGAYGVQPGWFQTTVDDTVGAGNERLWPTINSPEALATHTIAVRIHAAQPYRMIGSGTITASSDGEVQVFSLDTGRAIASYTVLLAAVPAADVTEVTFDAGGVPVTILSTQSAEDDARAEQITVDTLAALGRDFGAYPAPALQILMTDWPDGMEYYGGTETGLSSLSHELVHLYWGCSAVNRTWRDTWFDESVNEWWEFHEQMVPLPAQFTSGIVGGHAEIEPGFDGRAYGPGALAVNEMAERLGGPGPMTAFLADLYARRVFAPYTTDDLLEDLVATSGDETLREDFVRWFYTP